jgi:hypothetical protein
MRRHLVSTFLVLIVVLATTVAAQPSPLASDVLFAPTFPAKDQLITNEYAFWNPSSPDAVRSADWDMTSGSLFSQSGYGWTGKTDRLDPGAKSMLGTNSAVFRLNTRRSDFGDVRVRFTTKILKVDDNPATFPVAWDGIHIWLRYQSEYSLYYASVARRDGGVLIKKKCPGGFSNGGTYYSLTPENMSYPIVLGKWRDVGATAVNYPDGSVRITLLVNGNFVVGVNDKGVGCPAIRTPGSVGIRGDNAEFLFSKFEVLAQPPPTPSPTVPPSPTPLPSLTPTRTLTPAGGC